MPWATEDDIDKAWLTLSPATVKLVRAGVPQGHPCKRLIDRWQKRLKGNKLTVYASEVKQALLFMLRYGL
jgi:hypothetical protein